MARGFLGASDALETVKSVMSGEFGGHSARARVYGRDMSYTALTHIFDYGGVGLAALGCQSCGFCVVAESTNGQSTYHSLAGDAKWPKARNRGILAEFRAIL